MNPRLWVTNPATGELIAHLLEDSPERIAAKYQAARRAQPAWAARPIAERKAILKRFGDLLVERREELARTLTREMGKPISQSRAELRSVLARVDYFVENVDRVVQDEQVYQDPEGRILERIHWDPLGVVACISAWNYPYFVGANVFVPALLTGNAVLYKPSEFASLTGQQIATLLTDAGVPSSVFGLIQGNGTAGSELVEQPVDGIFFTGSYSTGRKIAERAAARMIRLGLELGGKDPAYVCDDVDISRAAQSLADGAFYNTGQSCCSVERIYVHERIYDSFVREFVETVRGFKQGDPFEESTYLGPLARRAQLELLEEQVLDAMSKGATLALGGKRAEGTGYFFEPTVILDANHSMKLMREESFGPIIGIERVASDEEALERMNDTEYGLTAGVYTRDAARAERLLAGVRAGTAYWNCCDRVSPRLPWSGRGHSGLGSTLSRVGIQAFVQPKGYHLRQAS